MNKSDYTKSDKLTELRLDMSHPKNKGIVFILLEGDSDVRFYRKCFRQNTCKIEEVPGGKVQLEAILTELNTIFTLIMGIRDADFLHLEAKSSPLSNLFLTDYHDLETLLFNSDTAFSAVVHEFVPMKNQEKHVDLRVKFLNALKFLSYLRWYNEINKSELNFKGLNLGDIFDVKHFTINTTFLLEKVQHLSPKIVMDNAAISAEIEAIKSNNHDVLQLTNGHDLMKIMAIYLSSFNKKGISDKDAETHLRIAFPTEDFKNTQLYKDTYEWATRNKCLIHN
jgi:hypothetical protein